MRLKQVHGVRDQNDHTVSTCTDTREKCHVPHRSPLIGDSIPPKVIVQFENVTLMVDERMQWDKIDGSGE